MIQRAPGAKYHLIQRLKLGIQGWFWRKVNSFRCFTLVGKLYTISSVIFGVSVVLIGLTGPVKKFFGELAYGALALAVLALFVLALAFASAALLIVLYHAMRRLWGTTIGKFLLSLFLGLSSFVADFFGRREIYKFTGENPEAFTGARIALACLFTPLVYLLLSACVGLLAPFLIWFAQFGIGFLSRVYGHRRPLPAFHLVQILGPIGLFTFMALAEVSLEAHIPQIEPFLELVVVMTGFYHVPDGRYATVKPNSLVAFLPGDRICVVEQLPNGKINVRTIKRENVLGSRDGD